MGKRELLIIAGFVAVGLIVYQVTAPPSTGTSTFSFANLFNEARREMRGNPAQAEITHTATVPVGAAHREVRVLRVAREVHVIGEDRADIEYALAVSSTGPDDEAARGYAAQTVFQRDEVGDSLVLRVHYPAEARQQTSAVVRVPARLAVRVENATGVTIAGVAGAHIEATRGAITLTDIAGPVTGDHQDGSVTVTRAASVKKMRLTRLRSRFEGVTGGLTLDIRDGECDVAASSGPVEIDTLRATLTLTGHRGPVVVRGADGRVTLDAPGGESRVEMRRTEVEAILTGRVPVTILTTDQTARVFVRDTAALTLDALATEGRIQAADLQLTPETVGNDMKLVHTFGAGGDVRVTVRNTRGEIVLRR